MDDLDDVRAWLGYERINLFGLSYGTRAVLVYMRQHPDRVRTAILMGVAPTYLKMPLHHARAASARNGLVAAGMRRRCRLSQAFPQLQRDWQEVLERLGREPARVEYSPPDKSATVTVEIQRDIFAEKLRNRMYSRESADGFLLSSIKPLKATSLRFSRKRSADRSFPTSSPMACISALPARKIVRSSIRMKLRRQMRGIRLVTTESFSRRAPVACGRKEKYRTVTTSP